jgi:hypothetical protein
MTSMTTEIIPPEGSGDGSGGCHTCGDTGISVWVEAVGLSAISIISMGLVVLDRLIHRSSDFVE